MWKLYQRTWPCGCIYIGITRQVIWQRAIQDWKQRQEDIEYFGPLRWHECPSSVRQLDSSISEDEIRELERTTIEKRVRSEPKAGKCGKGKVLNTTFTQSVRRDVCSEGWRYRNLSESEKAQLTAHPPNTRAQQAIRQYERNKIKRAGGTPTRRRTYPTYSPPPPDPTKLTHDNIRTYGGYPYQMSPADWADITAVDARGDDWRSDEYSHITRKTPRTSLQAAEQIVLHQYKMSDLYSGKDPRADSIDLFIENKAHSLITYDIVTKWRQHKLDYERERAAEAAESAEAAA